MGQANAIHHRQNLSSLLGCTGKPHCLQNQFLPITLGERRNQLNVYESHPYLSRCKPSHSSLCHPHNAAKRKGFRHRESSRINPSDDSLRPADAYLPDPGGVANLGLLIASVYFRSELRLHICAHFPARWQMRNYYVLDSDAWDWHT